ncbi:MAG: hypothetical protein RLZZ15_2678 [Verrucomicrobiota bacterium]|jgi:prevent-host-death family protein
MTATLEQNQTDLAHLLGRVRAGDEVVITQQGRPVARLTGVPPAARVLSDEERGRWLAELAELRRQGYTGKAGPSVETILDELREERGA